MNAIALEEIHFRFDSRPILDGVSLTVRQGEWLAIVGPNGAGKTTLLRVLAGLATPDAGQIVLDGKPLSKLSRRQIAQQIAYVSQQATARFPFRVREAVAMARYPWRGRFSPLTPKDWEIIERALDEARVRHLAERKITELSGGELQRVAIARALAQATPLLALDEPIASLDLFHQFELLDQLRKRGVIGHTTLTVLHDLNLAARFCDRVAVVDEGKIKAIGTPEEVLTAALLADVFHVEATISREPQGGRPQAYVVGVTDHDATT